MASEHELREIEQLTASWADAELRGDHVFLAGLLADDFTAVGPLGFLLTRELWLNRYRGGALQNSAFTFDETQTRLYGDSAIVIGKQSQQATVQGRDASGEFRVTLVFERISGSWRLASVHLSQIATPPGPR